MRTQTVWRWLCGSTLIDGTFVQSDSCAIRQAEPDIPKSVETAPPKNLNVLGSELARMEEALEGDRGADQQRLAQAGLLMVDLLLRKNADYGSSAWKSPLLVPGMPPRKALLVRMSDKLARLANLSGKDTSPQINESVMDTMRDLAGYALLWTACPEASENEGVPGP